MHVRHAHYALCALMQSHRCWAFKHLDTMSGELVMNIALHCLSFSFLSISMNILRVNENLFDLIYLIWILFISVIVKCLTSSKDMENYGK